MEGYLRAEISVSAIRHNLGLIRTLLAPGVKVCPVVKANAYGCGMAQVLGVIGEGSDMLGVAVCSEAVALRELGWQRPVMMFTSSAASDADALAELIGLDVTLTITHVDELALLKAASARAARPADVHVMVDTGMTRSGSLPRDVPALVAAARQAEWIRLSGMFTHFACAEDRDKSTTIEQFRRFQRTVADCGGPAGLTLHAANSAAAIDLPETHLDMIRPGIAVYGYPPSHTLQNFLPLKPSLRLTAPIVLIKDVPAGVATGYGLTYRFHHDARLALVPIGYADGYFRTLSNVASMRLHGVDCPVRGRVSMDQTIVEITAVADAKVGDAIEIISTDPAAAHSVDNLARLAGTVPYEIISRLGDRITRVVAD